MQFLDGMWMGGSSRQQLDLLSPAIDPWINPCEARFANAVLRPVTPKPTPLHPSSSMANIFSTSDHGVSPSLESTSRGPASTTAATASPEVYRHHQSRRQHTSRGSTPPSPHASRRRRCRRYPPAAQVFVGPFIGDEHPTGNGIEGRFLLLRAILTTRMVSMC
ncbi:hypothetical protein SORBI_3005G207700 [Sorghum bicolor]|uniref:Uncharacterized protein n=1 Tax=Sorghum bicolor TaxID=4558 RepID=A0A1B6PTS6_SORBI|nr:hypothetical protein SORBI_3005G207700 [Sorghum bicolor]